MGRIDEAGGTNEPTDQPGQGGDEGAPNDGRGLRAFLANTFSGQAACVALTCMMLASSLGCAAPRSAQSPDPDDSSGDRQARIFAATCAHCHVGPDRGVPRVGMPEEWNARETRDFDTLVVHSIEGYRDMPPLGTCGFCTTEDIRQLVALMVAGSEIVVPDLTKETAR